MPDEYDVVRMYQRGFEGTGAHPDLEAELRRGRMQNRGFGPNGVPTRARPQRLVQSPGDPLFQPAKPGADTDGGPLHANARPAD